MPHIDGDLLADRSTWTLENCTIANALDVIGNRIALLLVREAFLGTTRFDHFAERVGVSEPAAAKWLAQLAQAGVLERAPYREPGQRARLEYHLTAKGLALRPVLAALRDWGDVWAAGETGPPVHSVHVTCGTTVHAELRCERGHRVRPGSVALLAGPPPPTTTTARSG